jgi:hypothetical protein
LYLLLDENTGLREWAAAVARRSKQSPIQDLLPSHQRAIDDISQALLSIHVPDADDAMSVDGVEIVEPQKEKGITDASLPDNPAHLWSGLAQMIRFVPFQALPKGSSVAVNMRKVVLGHLHDNVPRKSRRVPNEWPLRFCQSQTSAKS